MRVLLVLSVILSPAQFVVITDDPAKDKGPAEGGNDPNQDKTWTLPTGKCEELSIETGKPEQEACYNHCTSVKQFSGGDCVEKICRCKLDLSNLIQSIAEKSKDKINKKAAGNRRTRNGVKCRNLIRLGVKAGSENHRGCGVHCRLLDSENKDGRCVEGVCKCTKEIVGKKIKNPEENEDEEEECENDEMCLIQCRRMNKVFNTGKCNDGTCSCSTTPRRQENHRQIPELMNRAVMKCEHRRKSANEEICRSHCESFSKDHTQGRCVSGICHCGYAVFELMVPEKEENNEKEANKKETKMTREMKSVRSRGRH